MTEERSFSTREVAQMWNVSESTIKRWADRENLACCRTPGGHRRFRLEDLCEFQRRRGFEASGLLDHAEWEDPDLELWLNQKSFGKMRELIHYLATQNQRIRIKDLLERLYIRGMRIEDIYDDVLVPLVRQVAEQAGKGELSIGQRILIHNNLEEALYGLSPNVLHRRKNGKTGLCASPHDASRFTVNAICRILDIEGWDRLNLGENVPFHAMTELVKEEPINLVCVVTSEPITSRPIQDDFDGLCQVTEEYRIPLVFAGNGPGDRSQLHIAPHTEYFSDFRAFRRFLPTLSR